MTAGTAGAPHGADLDALGAGLVRLAIPLSAAVAVFYLALGAVLGDATIMGNAAGPAAVAVIGAWQRARTRPSAPLVLTVTAAAIVVQTWRIPVDGTETGAGIALAVVGMLGAAFVERRTATFIGVYATLCFASALLWSGPSIGGVTSAILTAVTFVFGAGMFAWMRSRLAETASHYRHLFDEAPVSLWEEDFSAVAEWFAGHKTAGHHEFDEWLNGDLWKLAEGARMIRVLDANDAAVRLLEAGDRSQLLGSLAVETLTDDALRSLVPQFRAVWNGEAAATGRVEHGRSLAGKPIEAMLYWSAPRGPHGIDLGHVTVAIVDITELREAQAHLRDLLRSKDEFVASVSHELRTPLTTVLGLAEELRDRGDALGDGERAALIELVASQAAEVSMIVEDLLVAAQADTRTVTVNHEPVDLRLEARRVLKALHEFDILIDAAGPVPEALGDPGRVRQVVRNLVVNARRYGGPNVRIGVAERGDMICLTVHDDGPPLPEHQREAIFDRFYRAGQLPGLTASVGLGLAVSRELARLMGGDLTYIHDGDESAFVFTLPRA